MAALPQTSGLRIRHQYFTLHHVVPCFNDMEKEPFENIVGKGENAGNQHFLHFPQSFLPYKTNLPHSCLSKG